MILLRKILTYHRNVKSLTGKLREFNNTVAAGNFDFYIIIETWVNPFITDL
jgi:hypothetical protein